MDKDGREESDEVAELSVLALTISWSVGLELEGAFRRSRFC